MKKYMIAFILCGLITVNFTGCENKENSDISLESTQPETNFTTSVSSIEVTTVKEITETTLKVKQTETETPQDTVPIVKETQAPVANISPQTKPVIEQVTIPQTNVVVTEPSKPVTTQSPQTEVPVTITATPEPRKVLNEAFKQELTEYIQNYCNEVGLVYRDDGNTPENSSWDIPIRTLYGTSNEDIKERVRNRARIILINYGEGTVINLYFEDDWEASGEWRIYVLF